MPPKSEPEKQDKSTLSHELVIKPTDPNLKPDDPPAPRPPQPTPEAPVSQPVPVPTTSPPQAATPIKDGGPAIAPPTPPDGSSAPSFKIISTPWIKIALLGFFAPIIAALLFLIIFAVIDKISSGLPEKFAQIGLLELVDVALLAGTAYVIAQRLTKWSIDRAWLITGASAVLIVTSSLLVHHLQAHSLFNILYSGDTNGVQRAASYLSAMIEPLAGMTGLLLFTFIFENLYKIPSYAQLSLIAIIAVLPLAGAILYTPHPPKGIAVDSSGQPLLPRANHVAWAILPTKLPEGVSGLQECYDQAGNDFEIRCEFNFPTYPGYLSSQGQQRMEAYINSLKAQGNTSTNVSTISDSPAPWARISVSKNDASLQSFMIKDGKCDIMGLEDEQSIAPEYRSQNTKKLPLGGPQTCVKQTTPSGITLYMQQTTTDNTAQPYGYYFIKDGDVVVITHDQFDGQSTMISTVYYTDSNYGAALDTFVDSFAKNK